MSETVEQRLDISLKALDDYDAKFFVDKIAVNQEVEEILGWRSEVIRALSKDACFQNSFILAQFSAALQREINRQTVRNKWASHNLNLVVAKEYDNYGDKYVKTDIKIGMVCQGNEYAQALNKIILDSITKIEEFSFLSGRIDSMATTLREYGKSKRE